MKISYVDVTLRAIEPNCIGKYFDLSKTPLWIHQNTAHIVRTAQQNLYREGNDSSGNSARMLDVGFAFVDRTNGTSIDVLNWQSKFSGCMLNFQVLT